jgi:uncharacterized protein YndB with AHSA1/START domain
VAAKTGGSIVIDRPVEQVWAWLNDEQHDLVWRRPYLKELRRMGPYEVGVKFEGINKGGWKAERYVDEVTEYRPPVRIAWRQLTNVATVPRAGTYTLEGHDGHTKFTLEIEFAFTGIARALERPMSMMAKKMVGPTLLKQLKEAIEKEA